MTEAKTSKTPEDDADLLDKIELEEQTLRDGLAEIHELRVAARRIEAHATADTDRIVTVPASWLPLLREAFPTDAEVTELTSDIADEPDQLSVEDLLSFARSLRAADGDWEIGQEHHEMLCDTLADTLALLELRAMRLSRTHDPVGQLMLAEHRLYAVWQFLVAVENLIEH